MSCMCFECVSERGLDNPKMPPDGRHTGEKIMEIKPLIWTNENVPNNEVPYSHVIASTPFGRFLITWKGWKEQKNPTITETPWGGFAGCGYDVKEAKEIAEEKYKKKVMECLGL